MRLRLIAENLGAVRSGDVALPDGRRLAYAEWGAPDGFPVVHLHGMPGSRLETHAPAGLYALLGVRFITVDRPGYGASDPQRERSIGSWADDVETLADRLRLRRFGLTAISGGGPFALACASRLGDRLTSVALAGSIAPLDGPGSRAGMKWLNRTGLWLALHFPRGLEAAYRSLRVALDVAPDWFLAGMTAGKPDGDRALLARADVHGQVRAMLLEAVRGGVLGAVQEVRLIGRPWDFDPAGIRVPVHLWHGTLDDTAPIEQTRALAARIPNARLVECEGEGHMVMWTHLPEILGAVLPRALANPAA